MSPPLSNSWKLVQGALVPSCESMLSHSWKLAQLSHLWSSSCKLTPPLSSPLRLAKGVPYRAFHLSLLFMCMGGATSTSACRATGRPGLPAGRKPNGERLSGPPVFTVVACALWVWHVSCMHCSSSDPSSRAGLQKPLFLQLQTPRLCRSCLPQRSPSTVTGIVWLPWPPLVSLTVRLREALTIPLAWSCHCP